MPKTSGFLMATLMSAMFCTVSAQASTILFSTLGPNGEFDWNHVRLLGHPPVVDVQQMAAMPFTLDAAATVGDAVLALGSFEGNSNPVTVYIESDSGGLPGSFISALAPVGGMVPPSDVNGGGLVSYTCDTGCALAAGSYWLVAVSPNSQGWDWDYWYYSSLDGALGNVALNSSGSATGPWSGVYSGLAAFRIDSASSVPEPNSFAFFGSGLLGVVALARRQKSR